MTGVLVGFCGTLLISNSVPNSRPNSVARHDNVDHGIKPALPTIQHRLDAIAGTARAETIAAGAPIDPSTRLTELTAIATAGDPANLPDLIAVLAGSPEASMRAEAAQGLAEIGGESAALALETALDDQSAMVRRMAIEALVASADSHAGRVLRRSLHHPNEEVGRRSADALGLPSRPVSGAR